MKIQMLIGSDPEIFLKDKTGKFISAIGLIGGSKDFPRKIREDGCAVQEDNVGAEFNIPPCRDANAFCEAISFNLSYLTEHVKEHGLSLAIEASAEFEKDQLAHPMALEFGCEPDMNAWTQMQNPRPHAENAALRSCGGHVHIGCAEHQIDGYEMIKACDLFLGVPSVLKDSDTRRRLLYGKAGACRIKPYGAEYRTLSNFWLKDEDSMKWVYAQTLRAAEFVQQGGRFDKEQGDKIQYCINHSDKQLVKELSEEYGL